MSVEKKKDVFYVYSLIDPINNKIFYIGKGKGDRCNSHTWNNSKRKTNLRVKRILKIQKQGLQPIVKILHENLSESKAFQYEKIYIKMYGRRDIKTGILCNHTDGGDGSSGWVPSEETKNKIAKSNTGKKASPETIEKLRVSHTGYKHTEEQKRKIGEAGKGRKRSKESIEKTASKNRGRKNTEEMKQRAREMYTQEQREILIQRNKEFDWTDECRAKLSTSLKKSYNDRKNRETSNNV